MESVSSNVCVAWHHVPCDETGMRLEARVDTADHATALTQSSIAANASGRAGAKLELH